MREDGYVLMREDFRCSVYPDGVNSFVTTV